MITIISNDVDSREARADSPLISAKKASLAVDFERAVELGAADAGAAVAGVPVELAGVKEDSLSRPPVVTIPIFARSAALSRITFSNFSTVNSDGGPKTSEALSMHNSTAFINQVLSTNSIILATLNLNFNSLGHLLHYC